MNKEEGEEEEKKFPLLLLLHLLPFNFPIQLTISKILLTGYSAPGEEWPKLPAYRSLNSSALSQLQWNLLIISIIKKKKGSYSKCQ